jgi:hypothetical protein
MAVEDEDGWAVWDCTSNRAGLSDSKREERLDEPMSSVVTVSLRPYLYAVSMIVIDLPA